MVATILITIEVSLLIKSRDYEFVGQSLFVEYYIALALYLCPFYGVLIPQAY